MNPAHLDYDALADLAEGLLDDADAASANAHLDDCAECRERSAEIADVSRILADVPVPPMPAELAARIDEAIRAESMHGSGEHATIASIPHHALERRRGKRRLRVISAAAAAVVVLGGGAVLGNITLNGSLDGDDHAATSHAPADRARREGGAAPLNAGAVTVTRSGTVYRSATLGEQVSSVITRAGGLPKLERPPAGLIGCVDQVTLGTQPVLVDSARFENREVTVIVVHTDGSSWRVVVAGPKCSADVRDVIAETEVPATTP
ncbi:hypothetical protein SAMN04489712_115130 [Thermomonospora echinospora]|uniref:Zinc-finger n=1 Tax=Thermomonospora echinospora TaxID=1992 RepID=A0A1H6DEQ2_9ACTN|nr:hypothetical protein [Thermomonospora echinospora]SEG83046.1 hypothetical protein SAMN04489712_115130 [Thermomonospora echinospora]